jgi:hypothetical protein
MFVRIRKTKRKIQFTVVETRRVAGKVAHEHVGSLGSIATPMTVAGRIAFWQLLHERLARLGNRINTDNQGKILAGVHAQVPMVTPDEQRALQVENAEADERLWSWLREAHADNVNGHQALVAKAQDVIASTTSKMTNAAEHAAAAKERLERIRTGETLSGGLSEPKTYDDLVQWLRDAGFTKKDIKHIERIGELGRRGLYDVFNRLLSPAGELDKRERHRIAREVLRRADEMDLGS